MAPNTIKHTLMRTNIDPNTTPQGGEGKEEGPKPETHHPTHRGGEGKEEGPLPLGGGPARPAHMYIYIYILHKLIGNVINIS